MGQSPGAILQVLQGILPAATVYLTKLVVDGLVTTLESGSSWQTVRGPSCGAPFIILDEPTSALNHWSEAEWLGQFRKLAVGRTAVMITHRFTTAMHADVIHVMEPGRIVESGNHDELLERDGRYAESWNR